MLVHAQALLTSSPEGACDYIDADVRDPEKILAKAAQALDFGKPIALMMLGILGQIPDSDHPETIVARLIDGLQSGSYVTIMRDRAQAIGLHRPGAARSPGAAISVGRD